jgi:glycosyltransferase involved in cell wall biosynthesis
MIVELVGLPGSGKTTFAKRLAERESWKLITISRSYELFLYNALFLLRHPISFARGLWWLCRYRGVRELWYTKFVNLFLVHNAKYMKAARCPRAIIDQGHHQNIISLFDTRVADDTIDEYRRILPKPDLLCFFLADEETREKRLAERGYGAREEWSANDREDWEDACAEHFEHLYVMRDTLSFATAVMTPEDEAEKLEKLSHARVWCFVLHARMPTEKAHGLQIAKTLEALAVKGTHATLWVPRRKNVLTASIEEYYNLRTAFSVRVFPIPDFLRLPRFLGQLRFWIDAFGFFLVLLFARVNREGIYYTRNPEIAWLFKMKGAHVWYEAHLFPSTKTWLLRFFLAHVDGIIANSQGTADAFTQHGFSHVHVVRNGVDLERFLRVPTREESRALLDLPHDKTIVMYVGAFYEWKGVPFLLETWQKNFGDRSDLLLVLVGGTANDLKKNTGNKAYRESINITLVPHAPAEQIPTYLAAADILVLPNIAVTEESIRYTSPIKLFEYMASGRPIIAADLPSICEVLSAETALLFEAGNTDALASGIEHILSSLDEAERLGERAQQEVCEYSWEKRAQLLLNIVRSESHNRASTHAQFVRTIMAGGVAALFQLLLIYVLTEYFDIWYAFSIAIGFLCALSINFLLLKLIFVGGGRKTTREFLLYISLAFFNLFLNELVTYLLVEDLHVWYMLAQFLIVGTLAITNFLLYRSYIFLPTKHKE